MQTLVKIIIAIIVLTVIYISIAIYMKQDHSERHKGKCVYSEGYKSDNTLKGYCTTNLSEDQCFIKRGLWTEDDLSDCDMLATGRIIANKK